MPKIKRNILIGISLLLAVMGGVLFYRHSKITNVFDEIYYAGNKSSYTKTSFTNVNQVYWTSPDIATVMYDEMSIKEGQMLAISFLEPDGTIYFNYSPIRLNTGYLYLTATYSPATKVLIYNAIEYYLDGITSTDAAIVSAFLNNNEISKEKIEHYKGDMLYTYILPDWISGNANFTRFSMNNLGEFTVIDNTFSELGDDWDS